MSELNPRPIRIALYGDNGHQLPVAGEIVPLLSIEDELHPTRMVNRAKAAITRE